MLLEAVKPHRAEGRLRRLGDRFTVSDLTAAHLLRHGFVRRVDGDLDWHGLQGRELRSEPLADPPWPRVVACLNIWNDRPALEQTMRTWLPYVDHVIAVDGPYVSVGAASPVSTDGLNELLADLPSVDLVTRATAWSDQAAKRNAYLERASPGDLLFIVDADEFVSNAEALRAAPFGDCIWVRVSSQLYTRSYGQPRLVRAMPDLRYGGRHHWLYRGDRLLATHQYSGAGFEHRLSPVSLFNARGLGHSPERGAAKRQHQQVQHSREQHAVTSERGAPSDRATGRRESLRIVQVGVYDAGLVGFRLHTAINTTTPHAMISAAPEAGEPGNPFHGPVQYDPARDQPMVKLALETADVIHCNLGYAIPDQLGVSLKDRRVVIHHHGTMFRTKPHWHNAADKLNAGLRLVSNLELLQYGSHLHWLPNPVPVARYQRLRAQLGELGRYAPAGLTGVRPFRIAHSPSKRDRKGTDAFLAAVAQVRSGGFDVEAVLIEGESHGAGLLRKAACDACFDSFALGIQCSGLEAAAMGMPVIAGDEFVAQQYERTIGSVPYTFADTQDDLVAAIERLAISDGFYHAEAQRVHEYVTTWHDDAAVALRYLDLLDQAFGWRQALAEAPKPETHTPPRPETPKRKPTRKPKPQPVEHPRAPEPETRTA